MRTTPTLTTLTLTTITLTLSALTACTTPTSQPGPQDTAPTSPSYQQYATSPCLTQDSSHAPGGYCLYPAKVTWLDEDVLPVSPATLDWSDPDAVAQAYTITAGTWDSRTDASGAYATRRAAVLTSSGRTTPDTTDPDTPRGDAEYTTTRQQDSYTTVEITSVITEGPSNDPLQPDGTWRRLVTYTRTVRTRTDGATPYQRQGSLFLTLAIDPDTRQWLVTAATPTSERDVTTSDHATPTS